ncbi:hypothetical protein ODY47_07375 [Aerococcus urinae]|uniref:CpsB/CapC family capsule biosynthesis tyrosine phosphatase n=1 Tax=Aerococcus urinae TaxID=1376 RepID=UPI00227B2E1C|nr:CpsB/CapC family capsule biosynthesis tyrosine phosphatase [Aerococcus urinae]MCY3046885.1 hypothetical protein [Aerococcus urinae]
MLVDMACHIAKVDHTDSNKEQLAMANTIWQSGVTHVLATASYPTDPAATGGDLVQAAEAFQEDLDRRGIALMVYPGQIIDLAQAISWDDLSQDILYADLNQRYVLVKLNQEDPQRYFEPLLFEWLKHDIRPVLVQIEENQALMRDIDQVYQWVDQGCYTALTAGNLLGRQGKQVKKQCHYLLEAGLAHLLGSFSTSSDDYQLRQAYATLENRYGQSISFDIQQNARALINGDPLIDHFQIKKKKRFWFF